MQDRVTSSMIPFLVCYRHKVPNDVGLVTKVTKSSMLRFVQPDLITFGVEIIPL